MVNATPTRILVIDDDPAILRLYQDRLSEEGYDAIVRRLPPKRLSEVTAVAPAVILLDLVLGTKEVGLRFLARLKSDPATAAIPVLVCTAAADAVDRAREILTDADCGILLKPFDIQDLLDALRSCLDRHGRHEAAS